MIALKFSQRAELGRQWGLKREQLSRLDDQTIIDLWRLSTLARRKTLDILFPRPPVPAIHLFDDEMPALATGPNLTPFGGSRSVSRRRSRPAPPRPATKLGQGVA
jgi:hypothetical protein